MCEVMVTNAATDEKIKL